MESEFVTLEKAGTKVKWLWNLLANIPKWYRPLPSISLHCDSQAAIACTRNKIYNGKKRHTRLRHNIVRELISNDVITMEFVQSEKNLVDPLTKGLTRQLIYDTSKGWDLSPLSGSPMMTTQPMSTKGSTGIIERFKIALLVRMKSHCPSLWCR